MKEVKGKKMNFIGIDLNRREKPVVVVVIGISDDA
jgi:hypothetical protein